MDNCVGKYMDSQQLENLVTQKLEAGNYWYDRYYFRVLDKYMYLPTLKELKKLLKILKPDVENRPRPEEEIDCDDFAKFLLGLILPYEELLGLKHSMCIGMVEGYIEWGNLPGKELHFWNWAVTADEEIWWIEPQTTELHALNKCDGGIDFMMA
jgi:hypothetical protein